jgi:hypothetical protein
MSTGGPYSLLYNGYRVSFAGVKRPGSDVKHPPTSSAEIKERVELYVYSHSGPSWRTLLFFSILYFQLPQVLNKLLSFKICDRNIWRLRRRHAPNTPNLPTAGLRSHSFMFRHTLNLLVNWHSSVTRRDVSVMLRPSITKLPDSKCRGMTSTVLPTKYSQRFKTSAAKGANGCLDKSSINRLPLSYHCLVRESAAGRRCSPGNMNCSIIHVAWTAFN